jgi:hypothetical protein
MCGLPVICVLQNVLLFREKIHNCAILQLCKTYFSLVALQTGMQNKRNIPWNDSIFACFAISRNRNQFFHRKPLAGSVKSTAASLLCYCFAKRTVYRGCEIPQKSSLFSLSRCFAKQLYIVSSQNLEESLYSYRLYILDVLFKMRTLLKQNFWYLGATLLPT